MLDPRLLRAFVAIADSGSFTIAAQRLHMTQSTISQQLGRLEQAVGHMLVDRAARPVRPTAAGERLLGHARRILSLQQEAESLLADPAGSASIRIGLPDDIARRAMMRVFARFSEQYRAVRLDVTTGLSRDLTRRYRAGEFDIIAVKEPTPSADCRASFAEPIGWHESADRQGDWPDPLPLVAFPAGGLYRDAMFDRIGRERRRCHVAFTGSDLTSVLTAVEAGMGLSLVPMRAAAGRAVRPYAPFGAEADMRVSLYAWDDAGPTAELVAQMAAVLAAR
ncbi:LysR family transcriptional regulator [Sphingobium yanoikuyae]|uniref:LysR family transcriptional regulator n=1 Tax=Sphingobium yanoikuyae TaxID=13690 RepID=UPI00345E5514